METDPGKEGKVIATTSPWDEDVNQVIISEDGGENFKIIRKGLPKSRPKNGTVWEEGYPRAITISPDDPEKLYLGIDGAAGGLYISRNGGWRWQRSKGQPASRMIYNALQVDPSNTERLLWGAYGKNGGVYVSEDGGNNWERVFSGMEKVVDMAIGPEGAVYISGEKGGHPAVFHSEDRGRNWSLLKEFPGEGSADALFIHPQDGKKVALSTVRWHAKGGGKVWWSNDGGLSWQDITGDLPVRSGAAAIALDEGNSDLYVLLYAGSVYRTKISPRQVTE